jgi:catalase
MHKNLLLIGCKINQKHNSSQEIENINITGLIQPTQKAARLISDVKKHRILINPANIVPGIGFSPDKMLQGRLFSYGDAQRYRLGVNHHLIPVNKPRCPFHSFHRDGAMRVDGNHGSTLGYQPNSYGEWQEQPDFAEPQLGLEGAAAHWNHREDNDDYYSQAGNLFRLMRPEQQQALFENTSRAMGDAPEEIKIRHIGNCLKADQAYGEGVAKAMDIPLDKIPG